METIDLFYQTGLNHPINYNIEQAYKKQANYER